MPPVTPSRTRRPASALLDANAVGAVGEDLALADLLEGDRQRLVAQARLPELPLGGGQAFGEPGLVLGPPLAQSPLELGHRGRLEQDQDRRGHLLAHLVCPLDVDLEHDVVATLQCVLRRTHRRSVPVAEDLGPLEEPALTRHLREPVVGDEDVVHPVLFVRTWWTGGRGDRHAQAREAFQQVPDDGPFADPRGTGDDEEPAARFDRGYFLANSASSASRCFAPRPRTRRLAEMSNFSMIFVAGTFPTPGSDSSTVDTFIFPTVLSSVLESRSFKERLPDFSSPFSSARLRRASAAFARACLRCSSVRIGRGMRRSFVVGGRKRREYSAGLVEAATRIQACHLRFSADDVVSARWRGSTAPLRRGRGA